MWPRSITCWACWKATPRRPWQRVPARLNGPSCGPCTNGSNARWRSAFHLTLLDIAGNRWAQQVALDLRKVMKLNRHHSLFKQGRLADSLAEHRALMQAIEERDSAQAAVLMQAHFREGLDAAA